MSGEKWTIGKGSDDRVANLRRFCDNHDHVDMTKRVSKKKKGKTLKDGVTTRYVYG